MVPYRTVFEGLTKDGICYLVAGGFAVNFHQVQRATVDLDLILQIERANILKFVALMKNLGFSPRVPVRPEDFADNAVRTRWITEKQMMVFSFVHHRNPFEVIDVFCDEPIPFDELWAERLEVSAFGFTIPVVGKAHLIALKKRANREKDNYDIEQLKKTPS